MPPFLECEESKPCSAVIHPLFGDEGGAPALSFTTSTSAANVPVNGLPAGAQYDSESEKLTYTPDYGTVDTSKDPGRTTLVLNVEATLRKAGDGPTVYKRRNLLITVRNTPRPLTLQFPSVPTAANEGDVLHASLTVASADFPAGPFELVVNKAPPGVTFAPNADHPSEFDLTYSIPYDTVGLGDSLDPATGRYQKVFPIEYTIFTPTGEAQTLAAALTVSDTRLAPLVSYPTDLTQGPVVDFTIRADDLNGERAPVVNLPTSMPVGNLTVKEIPTSTPGIYAHLYDIRWEGIPATEAGKTFDFPFLVCGATSPTENTQCKNYVTHITIPAAGGSR
jgi:hypothetical protein